MVSYITRTLDLLDGKLGSFGMKDWMGICGVFFCVWEVPKLDYLEWFCMRNLKLVETKT